MSRITTSRRALTISLLVMVCAFGLLQACGKDKKTPPAPTSPTIQMGGARQGVTLNLSTAVTTLAGTAGASGSADGIGAVARFNLPQSVATDGTNLYLTDESNHTIRQIVIATGVVTTLAGTAGVSGSNDGIGSAALFTNPEGITTDGTNLYVTDTDNHTIRQIVIATGVVTTLAGTTGVSGSLDGTGAAARFNFPLGITTDGTNLYVVDIGNNTIRQIVIATRAVTTLAGTAGTSGSADGTGTVARFFSPVGITTNGANLYVTDSANNTIRQIVIATGVVTTLAGTVGTTGSTDGTGTAAQFDNPEGITTDGANLYVADKNNHTIRQIVIATGVVTTPAGTVNTPGSTDGIGAAARFNSPRGLTTDGQRLFIVDINNHTLRAMQ